MQLYEFACESLAPASTEEAGGVTGGAGQGSRSKRVKVVGGLVENFPGRVLT